MKKLLLVGLSVALSVILVDTAFSATQPQQSEPATVVKAEVETPLCYLQTPDGKTWNLNNLCEQVPEKAGSSKLSTASVNPYNKAAINKFDEELYGKNN